MDTSKSTVLSFNNVSDHESELNISWTGGNVTVALEEVDDAFGDCEVCRGVNGLDQGIFIIQLVFPVFTLVANSVTSVAIYRARGLRTQLRMSLLNLSFTDILASLLYMYHIAFSWTSFQINTECILRYSLFVASTIVTLVTIKLMSADRFISIFLPFVYEKLNQRCYVAIGITVTWVVTAVFVTIGFSLVRPDAEGCYYPLLMRPKIHLLYGLTGSATLATLIIVNIVLFSYTKLQISKIAATLVGKDREKRIARLESKATMTTLAVSVPYLLMNFPNYILMLYFYIDVKFTKTLDALLIVNALSSLSLVNSLINPSIYVWRLSQVRAELKKIGNTVLKRFMWRTMFFQNQ